MRVWLTAACLMLLIPGVSSTELDELLRTPQYLVISQYYCETIFEMNVAPKTCPRALVVPRPPRTNDNIECKIPFRAHLIRDPAQKFPPKILFLGPGIRNRGIAGILEDIKLPDDEVPARNRFSYSQHTTVEKSGAKLLDHKKPFDFRDVVGSIYDSSSQLLYVIADVRGILRCSVFYLKDIFSAQSPRGIYDRFSMEHVEDFSLHSSNGARFGWVEDPYNNTVYYSTREGDVKALHAFPISRLYPVLREGIPGHVVSSLQSEERTDYRVAGNGAIIHLGNRSGFLTAYIRSMEHSLGIVCATRHISLNKEVDRTPLDLPPVMPILIVRDEDFCMLRDGRDADLVACARERHQWLRDKGLETDDNGIAFLMILLIVVIIILATVILLLLVCICWLKRSLDETFDEEPQHRPVQYQYHQPAQYVDMDMSVDRWNY